MCGLVTLFCSSCLWPTSCSLLSMNEKNGRGHPLTRVCNIDLFVLWVVQLVKFLLINVVLVDQIWSYNFNVQALQFYYVHRASFLVFWPFILLFSLLVISLIVFMIIKFKDRSWGQLQHCKELCLLCIVLCWVLSILLFEHSQRKKGYCRSGRTTVERMQHWCNLFYFPWWIPTYIVRRRLLVFFHGIWFWR